MDNEKDSVRLNKYLSGTGLCSRREADKLIEEGHVTVESADGEVKTATLGSRVRENDKVYVDGKPVRDKGEEKLYMVINKPKGVICTGDRRVKENIIDFAGLSHYISYAGRLDRESTGLVLLTNDGDLNDKIMRAAGYHEKEYIVKVDRYITDDFLQKMSQGVSIVLDDDRHLVKGSGEEPVGTRVTTRPCVIERRGARKFDIILTQGYNRQIRRMCQALGYTAVEIKRVRIMNLRLGGLREGMKRFLTREEIEGLKALAEAPGIEPVAKVITNSEKSSQGDRPYSGKPYQKRSGDERPQGDRTYGEKPYRKPYGKDRPQGEKPYRKPYGEDRPQGDRTHGEKPYRKPYGEDRPQGDRTHGEKPYRKPYVEDRPQGGRAYGEKPYRKPYGSDRPQGERKPGDKDQRGGYNHRDKTRQGDRPYSGSRQGQSGQNRRSDSSARYGREDGGQSHEARREMRNHDRNDA